MTTPITIFYRKLTVSSSELSFLNSNSIPYGNDVDDTIYIRVLDGSTTQSKVVTKFGPRLINQTRVKT